MALDAGGGGGAASRCAPSRSWSPNHAASASTRRRSGWDGSSDGVPATLTNGSRRFLDGFNPQTKWKICYPMANARRKGGVVIRAVSARTSARSRRSRSAPRSCLFSSSRAANHGSSISRDDLPCKVPSAPPTVRSWGASSRSISRRSAAPAETPAPSASCGWTATASLPVMLGRATGSVFVVTFAWRDE